MDIVTRNCNSEFYYNFNNYIKPTIATERDFFPSNTASWRAFNSLSPSVDYSGVLQLHMTAQQLALVLQTAHFVTSKNEFCLTAYHFEVLCKFVEMKSYSIHAMQLEDI